MVPFGTACIVEVLEVYLLQWLFDENGKDLFRKVSERVSFRIQQSQSQSQN